MRLLDDDGLRTVLKVLLTEIKKGLAQERFLTFPPENIEIRGTGNVVFVTKEDATDLRGCLRKLGATLYHLATGDSEFSSDSYRIDGYTRPLDSRLWPTIALLVSGNACSIVQIEKELSFGRIFLSKMSSFIGFFKRIATWFGNYCVSLRQKTYPRMQAVQRHFQHHEHGWRSGMWVFWAIVSALQLLWWGPLNEPYSSGLGLFGPIIGAAVLIAIVCCWIQQDEGCSGKPLIRLIIANMLIPIILVAFAATSFLCDPKKDGGIVYERKTGKPVAVFSQSSAPSLRWTATTINPFRYRVKKEMILPSSGSVDLNFPMECGKFKYTFNTKIQYYMNDKCYFAAMKEWPNKDNMELAIKAELQKRYRPELERMLKELYLPVSKKKLAVDEMLANPKYLSDLTGTFRPKNARICEKRDQKNRTQGNFLFSSSRMIDC